MNYQVTSATGSFTNSGNLVSNVNWDSTIASFIGATQPSTGGGGGLNLAMDASLRNCGLRH
jgi:hypothetical protein